MIKTQQVVKSRGQYCGDIELPGYLTYVVGPVPLVMDLRVTHDRVPSSPDPDLNGHLRYPNNLDKSLNDTSPDKIRKYHTDYNNNPSRGVVFMTVITSTSGRLHSEFIRILFLQDHRETDRFFTVSGVLSAQSDRGFFHYLRTAFSSMFKSRVRNILTKVEVLRIDLNLDGVWEVCRFLIFSFLRRRSYRDTSLLVLDLTDKHPHDSLVTHILDCVAQFLPSLFCPCTHRGRVRQVTSNVKHFQCGDWKGLWEPD